MGTWMSPLPLHGFSAIFFLLAAAWVCPGGAPFSQLNIGVTDAMAIIKS